MAATESPATAAERPPEQRSGGEPEAPEGPGPVQSRSRPWRRARTPTLLQMEASECGAAALGIVLASYGCNVPLEQLRRECGVTRDGASAAAIVRCARHHGMIAKGWNLEVDVAKQVKPPFIAFWNLNHFLVVEGFKRSGVRVNDPADGPRLVTKESFDASFAGVIVALAPGEEFGRGGKRQNSVFELRSRLAGSGPALTLVMLASLLLAVGGLALPGFQRVFIENILEDGVHRWLWPLIGLMVAVAAILGGLTFLQQQYLLRVETKMSIATSSSFLRHVLRLPIEFFSQRQAADIANRVRANNRVAMLLSRDLATAVVGFIVTVVYAALLFDIEPTLAAIGVGLTLLNVIALRWVSRLRRDAAAKLQQDKAKLTAATYNGISMIETLKASGRESDYFARWAGLLSNVVSGTQRLGVPAQIIGTVPGFVTTVNVALILLIGSRRAIDGAIAVGLLVGFQTLLSQFSKPVNDLSDVGVRTQEAGADIARIRDVERYPERHAGSAARREIPRERLGGYLAVDAVRFGYNPLVDPLIDDFSLSVDPGQWVAIVGRSGSGKTTVARMIAGLLDPWSGEIRIDGVPRDEIPQRVLAATMTVVDQDLFLFEGSVRDNLTLWDDTIPNRTLVRALKDAVIYDEVMARPGQLQAVLAEDARDLSGGQRQRLEIARALAAEPTMLVLDEATSALDAETERQIYANIRRRGCSCVIVAHRLSTIRDCDEIIVMHSGAIAERGTHDAMAQAQGVYQDLIEAA